jgi:SAM-dependent methyltransferase
MDAFPLDLARTRYSYIERPNTVLVSLLEDRVLSGSPGARVLDVGCGCGANARAVKERYPSVVIDGIEPNERAAELARQVCDSVFHGISTDWIAQSRTETRYDAVLLSDVLEHIADPIAFLNELARAPQLKHATFIVSVPNYAVWYNRISTLLGRFEYAWSGLYDRTHLRFYTRRSIAKVLSYCGLEAVETRCTPSLVQSAAPVLRKLFDKEVEAGEHLALTESTAFKLYRTVVEPAETRMCSLAPGLLGFQIVLAARATG